MAVGCRENSTEPTVARFCWDESNGMRVVLVDQSLYPDGCERLIGVNTALAAVL